MKKYSIEQQALFAAIKTANFLIDLLLLLVIFLVLVYAVYPFYDSGRIYNAADPARYMTYKPEPEEEESPSFEELRRINSDVTGWLTLYGTGIDYPFVYSDEHGKYMNTDPEMNFSLSGSLFLDVSNHPAMSDPRNIIYGHHMEKSKMFGDLDLFQAQEFFDRHQYGNIYFNGKNHGYALFAYIEGDAYDSSLYGLSSDNAAFLSYAREHAVYWRDGIAQPDDQLLLLSTCASDFSNARYIVVGVITDRTYHTPCPEDTVDWGILTDQDGELPVWMWLVAALVLLSLLFLLLALRHRKGKKPGRWR